MRKMRNTVKTELLFYNNLCEGKEIQIMLDNNIKLYEMHALCKRKTHKNFYNALCNALNDDVKQLIPTFIIFGDVDKSINLLNMYISMIDLDEVFDKYLYLINCFNCALFSAKVNTFKEICEYMFNNKINMNKYMDRIIAICIKNIDYDTKIYDIKGIELSQEQEEYYNRYVTSKDDTFERIIVNHAPQTFADLYALVNCKNDAKVDENIYDAYENNDVVYINKNKHVPNFVCLVRSYKLNYERYTYTPYNTMDTIDRIYKLNIHELATKNIDYDMNEHIKVNDILNRFSSGSKYVNYTCTVKEYIEDCCNTHYLVNIPYYDCVDVMKYHYVKNTLFINIFTRLNKYDVYINFGNLVYYILDNYL